MPTYSISDVFRSGDPELLNSQLSPHEVSYRAHARRTQLSTRNTIMSDHENLRADQTTTPQSVQTRNHAADELGHLNFSTLQANAIEDSLIPDINGISPHFFPPNAAGGLSATSPFPDNQRIISTWEQNSLISMEDVLREFFLGMQYDCGPSGADLGLQDEVSQDYDGSGADSE